jgi:hypothetical protein
MPKQKSFMTCCKKSALSGQRKNGWGSFGCPISRRSRSGVASRGKVRFGEAVKVWAGMVRSGQVRRSRSGAVWLGAVRLGEAVKVGLGLV